MHLEEINKKNDDERKEAQKILGQDHAIQAKKKKKLF